MLNFQATGSLGKDCEVKELQDGKKVINFSVAVSQGYGTNQTTLWVECAKFGDKTAVAEYLKKGTKVYISGEPNLHKWEKDGKSGTVLRLTIHTIELLTPKKED